MARNKRPAFARRATSAGRTLEQQAEFVRSVGVLIDVREDAVQSTVLQVVDAEP